MTPVRLRPETAALGWTAGLRARLSLRRQPAPSARPAAVARERMPAARGQRSGRPPARIGLFGLFGSGNSGNGSVGRRVVSVNNASGARSGSVSSPFSSWQAADRIRA